MNCKFCSEKIVKDEMCELHFLMTEAWKPHLKKALVNALCDSMTNPDLINAIKKRNEIREDEKR